MAEGRRGMMLKVNLVLKGIAALVVGSGQWQVHRPPLRGDDTGMYITCSISAAFYPSLVFHISICVLVE